MRPRLSATVGSSHSRHGLRRCAQRICARRPDLGSPRLRRSTRRAITPHCRGAWASRLTASTNDTPRSCIVRSIALAPPRRSLVSSHLQPVVRISKSPRSVRTCPSPARRILARDVRRVRLQVDRELPQDHLGRHPPEPRKHGVIEGLAHPATIPHRSMAGEGEISR